MSELDRFAGADVVERAGPLHHEHPKDNSTIFIGEKDNCLL
jgi:hypothetical protein